MFGFVVIRRSLELPMPARAARAVRTTTKWPATGAPPCVRPTAESALCPGEGGAERRRVRRSRPVAAGANRRLPGDQPDCIRGSAVDRGSPAAFLRVDAHG